LKGGNEYPDATRRPVTTSIALKLPLSKGVMGMSCFHMEEMSIRAAISLKQELLLQDIEGNENSESESDLFEQYTKHCINVDKLTLKFFFEAAKRGKVELALDLVHRLHNEKSFDIAIRASDQCNRMKLSDEIAIVKEERFPILDMDRSYDGDNPHTRDDDADTVYSSGVESQSIVTKESRSISPDGKPLDFLNHAKRPREESEKGLESQRHKVAMLSKSKPTPKSKNPFAINRVESPVKLSPPKTKPKPGGKKAQTSLSRLSSFSAKARTEVKNRKTIL